MNTPNIILWTISLILATFSITFAATATFFKSKANKHIKQTMAMEWTVTLSNKHFFDQMKLIQKANTAAIKKMKSPVSYFSYCSVAVQTRFAVISTITTEIMKESEFSGLLKSYIEIKERLDSLFINIIDVTILTSSTKIPKAICNQLIKYHNKISEETKNILKEFVIITSGDKNDWT